jgi:DNA invertase Pin-like site-specific DNA recombinase
MNDAQFDCTKLAVVYLRQSTPGQVRDHVMATEEQYRLREIPERLGFPADRILVVDTDLGVSGQTIADRGGMIRVLELIERGEVACVVVRDIGRLSRDEWNVDIGLIARACYQAGTRIVTPGRTYDPADPTDQLLLGVEGLLAGWDRGNLVRRLAHHRKAKQARGVHINGAVAPGYEKIMDVPKRSLDYGKLRITSDAAVRERITLILRMGLDFGGVLAVVRGLREQQLAVPVHRIEADGLERRRVIQWVGPTRHRVTAILKNPVYAGAIVNSRHVRELDRVSGRRRWVTRQRYEDCTVIRDAHEAYITWAEHHEILTKIARNNRARTYGQGEALLSGLGLLRCGICTLPMVVQYNNPTRVQRGRQVGNTPFTYSCTRRDENERPALCQNPAGPHVDRAIRTLVCFALDELDLSGCAEVLAARERAASESDRRQARAVEVSPAGSRCWRPRSRKPSRPRGGSGLWLASSTPWASFRPPVRRRPRPRSPSG